MKSKDVQISPAMEDYLETIYLLVGEKKVARVKDIAAERGVKPGSVSPAMKKLASMGLIRYEQREYIDLTPEGEDVARRTLARHELLRLAIPRRVYTQSHIDYVVEAILEIHQQREQIRGFEIASQPEFLRHFSARFRPL